VLLPRKRRKTKVINEYKESVIIKKISYKAKIIKKTLPSKKHRKTKVINKYYKGNTAIEETP